MTPKPPKAPRVGSSYESSGPAPKKSWEETAIAMAAEREDWAEWDCTLADGLAQPHWEVKQPGKR